MEEKLKEESLDFGSIGHKILRGLGNEWALAPVAPGCGKNSLRFVADGRDRAEFSSYFFQNTFFKAPVREYNTSI